MDPDRSNALINVRAFCTSKSPVMAQVCRKTGQNQKSASTQRAITDKTPAKTLAKAKIAHY